MVARNDYTMVSTFIHADVVNNAEHVATPCKHAQPNEITGNILAYDLNTY